MTQVPPMPLVFLTKDGKISRYNLRKFGELPYHLVRCRQFDDLCVNVLFNYQVTLKQKISCLILGRIAILTTYLCFFSGCMPKCLLVRCKQFSVILKTRAIIWMTKTQKEKLCWWQTHSDWAAQFWDRYTNS